jgi:cation diffusion facilitator family transporter
MSDHDVHDSCTCGHQHGTIAEATDSTGRTLLLTMGLNLLIPLCQIVGGVWAQSMAVVSDAMHNLSDFTALAVAYFAHRLGQRNPSSEFTFGYRRAEVLAALFNISILFGACLFILFEAASRLRNPEPVSGGLVMILAGIGILGNGLSVLFLRKEAGHSLNMRGAMLHMLADLMTSVVVLLNGFVLLYRPWYWLDPVLSVVIVGFILKNSWSILKQAARILMEGTPPGIDLTEMQRALEAVPGVLSAHHLHVWSIGSGHLSFSCHIMVPDQALSETEPLDSKLREILAARFNVSHAVFQFEQSACGENDILCRMRGTQSGNAHA